jgi:hypothetical protein
MNEKLDQSETMLDGYTFDKQRGSYEPRLQCAYHWSRRSCNEPAWVNPYGFMSKVWHHVYWCSSSFYARYCALTNK